MGGKWPARLADLCLLLIGVFQDKEMELYRSEDTRVLNNMLIMVQERYYVRYSATSNDSLESPIYFFFYLIYFKIRYLTAKYLM